MNGSIRSIPSKNGQMSNFAFIKGEDGKEYFLHASDLKDSWDELKQTIATKRSANLEFEIVAGLKGPRASNARIV